MATYIKGTISYDPVVEQINRKFVPRAVKCGNIYALQHGPVMLETARYMGGATKRETRGGIGACRKNYVFFRQNAITKAPSANQTSAKTLFTQAVRGAKHCLQDLNQLTRIQAAWMRVKDDTSILLNGVSSNGYTFKGWVMAVQYAGKKDDPNYDVNTFPTLS